MALVVLEKVLLNLHKDLLRMQIWETKGGRDDEKCFPGRWYFSPPLTFLCCRLLPWYHRKFLPPILLNYTIVNSSKEEEIETRLLSDWCLLSFLLILGPEVYLFTYWMKLHTWVTFFSLTIVVEANDCSVSSVFADSRLSMCVRCWNPIVFVHRMFSIALCVLLHFLPNITSKRE